MSKKPLVLANIHITLAPKKNPLKILLLAHTVTKKIEKDYSPYL